MRRWGIVVTAFYAALIAFFLVPVVGPVLIGEGVEFGALREPFALTAIALLVGGQILLLFLSVDTGLKLKRPRAHIAFSVTAVAFAAGLLSFSAITSALVVFRGDAAVPDSVWGWQWAGMLSLAWGVWGYVFYRRYRSGAPPMTTVIDRLMKASVLELLVVVPAHVIVRHRQDCSAPGVTAFGIVTGIAVMLMCFGPGVLFLYRSRIHQHRVAHGLR